MESTRPVGGIPHAPSIQANLKVNLSPPFTPHLALLLFRCPSQKLRSHPRWLPHLIPPQSSHCIPLSSQISQPTSPSPPASAAPVQASSRTRTTAIASELSPWLLTPAPTVLLLAVLELLMLKILPPHPTPDSLFLKGETQTPQLRS